MARAPRKPKPTETPPIPAELASPPVAILQKKKLIESVAETSGIKKKSVKPVVEAALAEIGAALARGDALNLPPLGKLSVNRTKDGPNAEVMILKLRRGKGGGGAGAQEPEEAAPDDED